MSGSEEPKRRSASDVTPDYWMIRPCERYQDEYDECKRVKTRAFQYFVYGERLDCSQWKKDFENCSSWYEERDEKALVDLVAVEKGRRIERLEGHVGNRVWERRTQPPEDWNKPLPLFDEKVKNSYLANVIKLEQAGGYLSELKDFSTKELCVLQ